MAVVVPALPVLARDLALFHTTDPLLSNAPLLVFHGPSTTLGTTSSRIQIHIFSPAGTASYSRLAVSPNSALYSAVSNLPREEQGDEVIRGIAFGIKKYFEELPQEVRQAWCAQAKTPVPSKLFGDDHVAILASRMTRIENVGEVASILEQAFGEQRQSWQDVDVVLPPGSIKDSPRPSDHVALHEVTQTELLEQRYGRYAAVINTFGDITFLPTSHMKRAPSKASNVGRSSSFLKQQKENVRRELCELLDTEINYVERVKELDNISQDIGADLDITVREKLNKIFPSSITTILQANSNFCGALRQIIEITEDSSIQDLESSDDVGSTQATSLETAADTQGITAVAKCLYEWLPELADPYVEYLDTHAEASSILRQLYRGNDTALLTKLQDIGEQKLTSLLIEPVQRLPRYTLYIDGIVKQLPARHPAIKYLLRAKDIVTDICSREEDATSHNARVIEKLNKQVEGWPVNISICGRLVSAVDLEELQPPFAVGACESHPALLLLFTDVAILLGKRPGSTTTAKALLADLETRLPVLFESSSQASTDLHFLRVVRLDAVDCTESIRGCILHLLTDSVNVGAPSSAISLVESYYSLRLEGVYEGKASRVAKELCKARIEGRYSEAERESFKWELRTSDPAADHSSLFSAIIEDSNPEHVDVRTSRASIRILVDIDKHSHRPRAGNDGIRTVVALSPFKDGTWRLTIDSVDGSATREHVLLQDLVVTLARRLAVLSQARFAISYQGISNCLLARNTLTLQSIDLEIRLEEDTSTIDVAQERIKRPKSPVKLLSNFLASATQNTSMSKRDAAIFPPPKFTPTPNSLFPKPPSRESRPPSRDQPTPRSIASTRSGNELDSVAVQKLENTLNTYLLALQARKGNIVGRSLKMRLSANELDVNELYNSLLEDPNLMANAAQASVDVLFAAFEKFLDMAWKNEIGPIMSLSFFQEMQLKAESLFPSEFDLYFRKSLARLPPPNQRAFKRIMELLADLLDGTGNDGDRGLLTAAFAEVLVPAGNAHNFIALIDRFVDDTDTYFGEPVDESVRATPVSFNAHKRSRSVNSSSITSNTSSLRRKFGLSTVGRSNSKVEEESKVASVWRSLSRSTRGEASPASSISKGSLHRAQSIEPDDRVASRPPSIQDGSSFLRLPTVDEPLFPRTTNQNEPLTTIGEHPCHTPSGRPRKKRRSSLSDLKDLEEVQQQSPASVRRPALQSHFSDDRGMVSLLPSTPHQNMLSPTKNGMRSRLPSSFRIDPERRQSVSPAANGVDYLRPSGGISNGRSSTAIPTSTSRHSAATLGISRSGLSERPDVGNIIKRPMSPTIKIGRPKTPGDMDQPSPRKLRMQSPQKLRERLQNESNAMAATRASFQDELSRIGDDVSSTPSRLGSVRTAKTMGGQRGHTQSSSMALDLAQRVLRMEGSLPQAMEELNSQLERIQADVTTSLAVSEAKCKKLDDLYREANGENEALYGRFNEELGRILKAVRGDGGAEELKRQLKESQDEASKLRREVSRLKRENVGLRAQMRE